MRADCLGESMEWRAADARVTLLFEQRATGRARRWTRRRSRRPLSSARQAGGDHPDANGGAGDEGDLLRVSTDELAKRSRQTSPWRSHSEIQSASPDLPATQGAATASTVGRGGVRTSPRRGRSSQEPARRAIEFRLCQSMGSPRQRAARRIPGLTGMVSTIYGDADSPVEEDLNRAAGLESCLPSKRIV